MDEDQVPSPDETLDFDDDTLRGKKTNSLHLNNAVIILTMRWLVGKLKLLYCSLNLLFADVLVAVAVVVS